MLQHSLQIRLQASSSSRCNGALCCASIQAANAANTGSKALQHRGREGVGGIRGPRHACC